MSASDLFNAGKLTEAIDAQIKEVKANPGDQARRLFLFEMLAFNGDLDRARKQIDVLTFDQVELQTASMGYKLHPRRGESGRRLFTEGLKPQFLADPPEHVTWRLEAVNRLREGNLAEAGELLQKANALPRCSKGSLTARLSKGFAIAMIFSARCWK